jgi:hypothetical protein
MSISFHNSFRRAPWSSVFLCNLIILMRPSHAQIPEVYLQTTISCMLPLQ